MASTVISLLTYEGLVDLDPDDRLLQRALEKRGYSTQSLVWDDPEVDWTTAGVCVFRSTWDYHLKYEKFRRCLQSMAKTCTLINSLPLLEWNSKKTYLRDLEDAALPIVPTVFIDSESRRPLRELLEIQGWQKAVLKPAVGLASSGVRVLENSAESLMAAEKHLDEMLSNAEVLLQEYLPSVQSYGERALSFIDGRYSHCVRKAAFQKLAPAGAAGESHALATDDEIALAEKVLSFLPETPVYARVDLLRDLEMRPCLIELELLEPSLFLASYPQAAQAFAEAIVKRLNS